MRLPPLLNEIVISEPWTFAKTMPEWPHKPLARSRVDVELFEAMVRHTREYGFEARFYRKTLASFAEDGSLYLTMGAPAEETTIINRCLEEDAYENRLRRGTLPAAKLPGATKHAREG